MTKPIETRRRGNGGRRLNKVEKDDNTGALVGVNPRCSWTENGQPACVWQGWLRDGLCVEHRGEMLRVERVKRWQEGRSRTIVPAEYALDHTAPWHCRLGAGACDVCEGKPDYQEWAKAGEERADG